MCVCLCAQVRVKQALQIMETQWSDLDIAVVAPDSDTLAGGLSASTAELTCAARGVRGRFFFLPVVSAHIAPAAHAHANAEARRESSTSVAPKYSWLTIVVHAGSHRRRDVLSNIQPATATHLWTSQAAQCGTYA